MVKRPKIYQAPDGSLYVSESEMQRVCVKWFRTVFAHIAKFLFSIPNGGKYGGKMNSRGFSIQAATMDRDWETYRLPSGAW